MKSINVLQFICPTGLHGAERWILALAKNLDRKKINCQLAVTLESEDQNIEVHDRFQDLELKAHILEMQGRFDIHGIQKLCRVIKSQNIDIIHTHGYKSDILGFIAAKITGIKIISTPHGFENVKDFKLQTFIRLGCFTLKYFDCISPLSEELEADMLKININHLKIHRIQNGVDLNELDSEKQTATLCTNSDKNEKRIGYVGQVIHRKNLGDMIKVFDRVYQNHTNIRLLIIGDGKKREELQKLADSLPSGKNIEFLGYRRDRLKFVKKLDLFCMTSSLEGIPRCMMEAMGMGIPAAAYNIPGVDKLIIQEKTGLMADFGDIEGLAECWRRLLFHKEFSQTIGLNGMKHVQDYFSASRMAEEYENLYKKMMR